MKKKIKIGKLYKLNSGLVGKPVSIRSQRNFKTHLESGKIVNLDISCFQYQIKNKNKDQAFQKSFIQNRMKLYGKKT